MIPFGMAYLTGKPQASRPLRIERMGPEMVEVLHAKSGAERLDLADVWREILARIEE